MQSHEITTQKPSNFLTYTLLAIILIQGLFNTYLLTWNSVSLPESTGIDSFGVKKALLEIEYDKVGWKENYDLITQANKLQLPEYLNQIKEFLATQGWKIPATTESLKAPAESKVLKPDEVKKILSWAYIEWSQDATILAIEYSEMECPFCAVQYHDTKIHENLKKQYGDSVAFSYKSNRWANHPGTETKAIGLLCAGKLGGQSAYTKFYTYVMDKTTLRPSKRDGEVFPVSKLNEVAKYAWVDVTAWQSCFEKKETASRFAAETSEAQSVWLNGTPWTLLLNTKTGKYDIVIGAAGYEDFWPKVDALLKE